MFEMKRKEEQEVADVDLWGRGSEMLLSGEKGCGTATSEAKAPTHAPLRLLQTTD